MILERVTNPHQIPGIHCIFSTIVNKSWQKNNNVGIKSEYFGRKCLKVLIMPKVTFDNILKNILTSEIVHFIVF